MKSVVFLYTGGDSTKAEKLRDYLHVRLRKLVNSMRSVTDILAEDQNFIWELRNSDCVVLIGSRQASSLIQNKQQENEDEYVIFDGKALHEEFTENRALVKDKLIIVYLANRTKNDWIPDNFDEKRVFDLQGENIEEGPLLYQLEYSIRRILGETILDW